MDSVTPSQEPPVDDKNDGVDLPSEETDGSRCPFPKLGPPHLFWAMPLSSESRPLFSGPLASSGHAPSEPCGMFPSPSSWSVL